MSTPSKPRRTSVSSTTSRTSTKSSWRVPLAKQIPRTQLSAVFAESEIPVSRSPGNQSAVAYLEARYNGSGPSSSSFKAPGISPSPSVERLRVSPSAQPVLMEEPVEIRSSQNPNSAEGVSKGVENLDYGNSGRGRQATQRHISLTGDSISSLSSNGITSPSQNVSIHITSEGEPDPSRPNMGVTQMDRQFTLVQQPASEDRKGKQSTVTGGWFGSSGKAKSQKIQQSIQAQDESNSTLSRDATIKAVPLASSPPREAIKSSTQVPTSSSWFSRSRTSTPASASPAPIPQPLPPTNASSAHPPNVTVPTRPPPLSITAKTQEPIVAPVAASPAKSSWFGNPRAQNLASTSIAPNANPSANSSTRGTPAIQTTDLPSDSSEDSEIDEAMVATVTPATFAQAKRSDVQALSANRAVVPTRWFGMNGKRGSMTPSIDSHVPTLPPTPQRDFSPPRTALVAIDTLMPLASPSLSTLGSSSARYTLSFPIRGRTKGTLEETLRQLVEAPAELEPGKPEALADWVVVLKSQSDSRALIPRSRAAPVVRKPRNAVVVEERVEEMVLEPGDIAVNGSSAASVASSHRPSSAWWPFGWTMPPSQDLHPPMAAPAEHTSAPVSTSPSLSSGKRASSQAPSHEPRPDATQPPPNSTPWLGIWPWGTGTSDAAPAKTEAELIKEQALARDKDTLPTPPLSLETVRQSDITPRPQDYERNPLADNVSENRASWMNFFSLKAAHGARKITLEGEGEGEGEEEVMDLSEDPDFPPPAPPISYTPEPVGVKGKVSNFLALKAVSGSSTRSSSAGPDSKKRSSSATPSKKMPVPKQPNIVLPTFEETFYTLPRALPPYTRPTSLKKVGKLVSGVFGINTEPTMDRRSPMKQWQRERKMEVPRDYDALRTSREVGRDLPRIGEVLGVQDVGAIYECKRIAILGVHGWFPGAIMRTLLGEPTGTSPKFASMMEAAVKEFMDAHDMQPEKITCMPLEGEGTIEKRVEKLYQDFLAKPEWVEDLHEADVIFVATHSQGSIVSTQLLDRFIQDGHIRTSKNWEIVRTVLDTANGGIGITIPTPRPPQRVCCLALCGIHLGPLLYLGTSSLVNPYIQYFESAAAKELFEFQDTESEVSKRYQAALENVLDHGTKFVYVASLDDQVVPIYSGVFTAVNHPRILRALYMDGDAYSKSDFLSNLLVLLLKMRNAGLDDGGLLMHLSEATAGSLSGLGHSTAYLDPGAYKLAVRFLFESSDALGEDPIFDFEPFTAKASRNDYEIPWALRGLITDPQCQELFGKEINELRSAFDDWQPKTSALKEVRKKLEPIRGRRSRFAQDSLNSPQSVITSPIVSSSSPAVKTDKR